MFNGCQVTFDENKLLSELLQIGFKPLEILPQKYNESLLNADHIIKQTLH